MTNEEYVQRFFADDGFIKLVGAELVEVNEKKAVVKADIKPHHLNANGSVQGGMLFELGDFAFATLANFLHPMTVTQGGSIQYIKPAVSPYVTATATEIVRNGHNTVSQVLIRDAEENIVCVCSFNGFVKDVERENWTWKMRKDI